jgi:hypothetical protein
LGRRRDCARFRSTSTLNRIFHSSSFMANRLSPRTTPRPEDDRKKQDQNAGEDENRDHVPRLPAAVATFQESGADALTPSTGERRHEVFALAGTRYVRLVRFSFLILIGRFVTLEA